MTAIRITLFILFLTATRLHAADLEAPMLSEPLAEAHFFDADRFLTTGGMRYSAAGDVTLEPELGIVYRGRGTEMHGGIEQSSHRLHAQAGGKVSLADTVYLSAAAKLPMVTVESVGQYAGQELGTRPRLNARQAYDFTSPSRSLLSWSAEFGLHLARQLDLTLYYDQNPVSAWYGGNSLQQEERIGTRFILRFK